MRRRVTGVCAGLLAGVMLCAAAIPAQAEEADGLWPEAAVESAHQQGLDGSGIRCRRIRRMRTEVSLSMGSHIRRGLMGSYNTRTPISNNKEHQP